MKQINFRTTGIIALLMTAIMIITSCSMTTSCGQTKGQAKKRAKNWNWGN